MTGQELLERLERDGYAYLRVVYHDYSGRACAKVVPRARFRPAIERGIVFARANLDFTLEDHQSTGAELLAHTGDFMAVPDPAAWAPVPYRTRTATVHARMFTDTGEPWEGCPRWLLERQVARLAERGLAMQSAFESEFYLFSPSDTGPHPSDHDGMFTLAGLDRHHELLGSVLDALAKMGIEVEQLGKEYGPGQYEGTTRHGEPVRSVDDFLMLRQVVKDLARDAGLVASFMPKPFADIAGCGLHLHLSLRDIASGEDVTAGEGIEPLSPVARQFLAGLLTHAPALTALGSPTVNSYKRLLPGSWAPAHACWGVGNRAALVRVPGTGDRRHLELRSGDSTCNPFIFLAAVIAAGVDGIERGLEPPPPIADDIGHADLAAVTAQGIASIPRSLPAALHALEADGHLMDTLGAVIGPTFLRVKRSEMAAYDTEVHEWERRTYLEAT